MEVYMFQEVYEEHNNCIYDTREELFYKEEEALKYMEIAIEEELRNIKDRYCDDDDDVEDYCEITKHSHDNVTIYMEDEFWISFTVCKKKIMSF